MKKNFRYIYEDQDGNTKFDRYFDYLKSVSNEMPATLFQFAGDAKRYELNGNQTLHDAWLTALEVSKDYGPKSNVQTNVSVSLLLSDHLSCVRLSYVDVISFGCSLSPSFWATKSVDLLTHEFSVQDKGVYRHFIQFDKDVWIELSFRNFGFIDSPVG